MEYDLRYLFDTLAAIATFLGIAGGFLGGVWLAFRKRLRRWWAPYRGAIEAMNELPHIKSDVSEIKGTVGMLEAVMRVWDDTNIELGKFECDDTGAINYVNQTFARWLGVGKVELLGWGVTNFIHAEDRQRWREEWDQARHEHRIFNERFRMIDTDGQALSFDVHITPIPERPPAKRWVGVLRRV